MQSKQRPGANDPGMSRRALLAAAPALALAAVPAGAAQSETPIEALFRDWAALYEDINSEQYEFPGGEEAFDAACRRLSAVEAEIMHTPSANATDLLMKIASFTSWGAFEISDCNYAKADVIWDEMRLLAGARLLVGGAA